MTIFWSGQHVDCVGNACFMSSWCLRPMRFALHGTTVQRVDAFAHQCVVAVWNRRRFIFSITDCTEMLHSLFFHTADSVFVYNRCIFFFLFILCALKIPSQRRQGRAAFQMRGINGCCFLWNKNAPTRKTDLHGLCSVVNSYKKPFEIPTVIISSLLLL